MLSCLIRGCAKALGANLGAKPATAAPSVIGGQRPGFRGRLRGRSRTGVAGEIVELRLAIIARHRS
jgi:hypothetical protein